MKRRKQDGVRIRTDATVVCLSPPKFVFDIPLESSTADHPPYTRAGGLLFRVRNARRMYKTGLQQQTPA